MPRPIALLLTSVCVLSALLFLYALPAQAQNQRPTSTRQPASEKQSDPLALPKTDSQAAKNSAKPALPKRSFTDLSEEDLAYFTINDLQKSGILRGYPDNYFSGKRPLTYYEIATAIQRVIQDMHVLTLTPDGKKLQSVIAIPHEFTKEQAQRFFALRREYHDELAAISDYSATDIKLTTQTLILFINAEAPPQTKEQK